MHDIFIILTNIYIIQEVKMPKLQNRIREEGNNGKCILQASSYISPLGQAHEVCTTLEQCSKDHLLSSTEKVSALEKAAFIDQLSVFGEGTALQTSEANALSEKFSLEFFPLARGANAAARAAFTLAEVLITLTIIGIVAALTIPNLIQNHNQKAWDTAADVFQKKLEVAARSMNTQEVLAGYTTTKAFVNELKKHIKITHICDNNELDKCFPKKVYWGAEQEEVEISDITSAKNFGQDDWGTEVIGVEFANGIDALIAYDPNCTQDPYNNQIQASNCMAILYDTSARRNPNSYGKDLRANGNVKSLGGITCAFNVGDTCYTNPIVPSPMTKAECEAEKDKLGIEACYYDDDYWAGAVKHCGGVNKLPTPTQLAEMATDLYGDHGFGTDESIYDLNIDTSKPYVSIFTSLTSSILPDSNAFGIWSGVEEGGQYSDARGFGKDFTSATTEAIRTLNYLIAVCVE